ncbi:MAG: DNA polymerase 1, partial [Candidatus Heimdallarchaeota archaeon LC_2]
MVDITSEYNTESDFRSEDINPWSDVKIISELEEGLILDGCYSTDRMENYHMIIYDPTEKKLVRYVDTRITKTNYYTYTHKDPSVPIPFNADIVVKTDLLFDKEVETIELTDLESIEVFTNEFDRKRRKIHIPLPVQLMYFHKTGLIPGTWISISNNEITKISKNDNAEMKSKADEIKKLLLGDSKIIIDLCVENMPIMEDAIPDIRRIAFDLEVASPRDNFPIPEQAEYPINSIATNNNEGNSTIFLLAFEPTRNERIEIEEKLGYKPKIKTFVLEKDLILSFYEEIKNYPAILTYNGDSFDLQYLFYRSKRLGIKSPIVKGRYLFFREEWQFTHSIHIDLYRILSNNAVRLYAFGAKYSRSRLMDVGEALVGRKKIEHDLWFDEMSRAEMIEYNIRDAELTMQLTTFNNNLTWKLLIILMRVGRLSLAYVNRAPISKWILNWIIAEHERRNLILPKKKVLIKEKGSFESDSLVDGKGFKGAIVLDPKPGVFWDVSVVDYNSLYPSTIKNFNLSYETMRCGHKSCESNLVPDLEHWVCRKRIGIMSSLVGFVREIRVRYYKTMSKSKVPDERELGNTIQAALKVFINASYGVFGAPNFYLYCPPVAESTTAISRSMLLKAKSLAEEMGLVVLGGDTDSIFVHKISKDQMAQLTEWSVIDLGIELGLDYTFRFMVLSSRKKNYFGITTNNKIIIKGLAIKKSNTAEFIKGTFHTVAEKLKMVQNEHELEEAKQFMIRLIYEKLQMLKDERFPFEDLQHMVSLNKKFSDYFAKTPAVQIALQEMNEKNEHQITRGTQYVTVKVKPFTIEIQTNMFLNFQK